MRRVLSSLLALGAATLATAVLASVIQSQINLATVSRLGAAVDTATRFAVTFEDLARFGPVMAGIALAALVLALPLAGWLGRSLAPLPGIVLLALTGGVGLWVAFLVIGQFSPMPALVAATGTSGGLATVCLSGLVGGVVYGVLAPRDHGHHSTLRVGMVLAVLLVIPVLSFFAVAPPGAGDVVRVDPPSYRVQTVATGLDRPWSVALLPDGRMLVTERAGRLLVVAADGTRVPIATENLPPVLTSGGAELMSLAVDPDFADTGWLFMTMGYGEAGANGTRLVRARLEGERLVDIRILFDATLKSSAGNNGGALAFLPDRTLVMSVGDGERRDQAQALGSHLGKLVRLDREGRVPGDNPYLDHAGAARELFTIGHRNPQGLAFDAAHHVLLLTEHGPRGGDEINLIEAGSNYGWPLVNGGIDYSFARVTPFARLDGFAEPLLEWTPSIAPAGLAIYDGKLFTGWQGDLLVPALRERGLRRVQREDGRIVGQQMLLGELGERLRDVKVASDGAVLVLTDGADARLLRIVPAHISR